MKITNSLGQVYCLSKKEQNWVQGFGARSADAIACIRYALMYLNREPKWLLEQCRSDIEYTTGIVEGFRAGFDAIVETFGKRVADPYWYPAQGGTPYVELARLSNGDPCGILVQRRGRFDSGMGRPDFWMTFVCDNSGKITNMHSGCLPTVLTLERSGIYAGVTPKVMKIEKAHKPHSIPVGVPLNFELFHCRGNDDWMPSAKAVRELLPLFKMAKFDLIQVDADFQNEEDVARLYRRHILALPHLKVSFYDEVVLHLDGPFDVKMLVKELLPRFINPENSKVKKGAVKRLLSSKKSGLTVCEEIQWLLYSDQECIQEIIDGFCSKNVKAARRAAYVLDRLSGIKRESVQPFMDILLNTSQDDDIGKLRHVAHILPRLTYDKNSLYRAETLLLQLSWQQNDIPLQLIALKSLSHFAKTNFKLREYAGSFVYDLMCRARDGRVVREAERTLDIIEDFEEKVHAQWDRLEAHV